MKNFLLLFYKLVPHILLFSAAIAALGGLMVYRSEFPDAMDGWLMGFSIAAFVVGLVILISQWSTAILGLGLLIFFILLGASIALSGKYELAGCGIPLAIFFLVGWVIWFSVGRDQLRNHNLLKEGVSAPGVIIRFKRTGMNLKVNTDYPKYGIELIVKVLPSHEPEFISKAEAILAEHEIANIAAEMPVTVRYDPKNKSTVSIESW